MTEEMDQKSDENKLNNADLEKMRKGLTEGTQGHHSSHHHHHHHHSRGSGAKALEFGDDWRPDMTENSEAPNMAAIMSDVSNAVQAESANARETLGAAVGLTESADGSSGGASGGAAGNASGSSGSASGDAVGVPGSGNADDTIRLTNIKGAKTPTGTVKPKKKRFRRPERGFFTRILIGILTIILLALLALTAVFFVMRGMGKKSLNNEAVAETPELPEEIDVSVEENGVVYYNGGKYRYKENLVNILLMGTDREGELAGAHAVEGMSSGQADTLFLLSMDTQTGESHILNMSRDSMVDVDEYNVNGEYTGTKRMQVCLAYAYGDGGQLSAGNVEKSVSRLLYGVPVNAYAAIDLDAIEPLNESVEGVQVEVLEDFSERDPELVKGTVVTLHGGQAEFYVRTRRGYDPDPDVARESNNMRMARQRQYVQGFVQKAVTMTKNDIRFPLRLYQTLQPYMVTDIKTSEVTYLASLFISGLITGNGAGNILDTDMRTLPGESVDGEEFTEYIINAKEAYPLILELFYDKI